MKECSSKSYKSSKSSVTSSTESCKNCGKSYTEQNSKDCECGCEEDEKPPAYQMFPTSMRIKIDPVTNAAIPSEQAVEDVKRWVDYNTK